MSETGWRPKIDYYVNNFQYSNAIFLAQRLVEESYTAENQYLLATCFYKAQLKARAIEVLEASSSSCDSHRYLLALCYYETQQLLQAKNILKTFSLDPIEAENNQPTITSSAALYLLGCIVRDEGGAEEAITYFSDAVSADPYNWKAFEALCDLGGASPSCTTKFYKNKSSFGEPKTFDINNNVACENTSSSFTTPTKKSSKRKENTSTVRRRSGRLAASKINKENSTSSPSSSVSHDEKEPCPLSILGSMAKAYYCLSTFDLDQAITLLTSISPSTFNSGWTQHMLGRAYCEKSQYEKSKAAFEHMRRIAPLRFDGIEIYSTVLWHLQNDVAICHLARDITTSASSHYKESEQVWCAIGNCFSRQKEHQNALKFFKRALQINPRFTYAHTLCGHEYVSNEDFDKAMGCYREAIMTDARHYNAWYGLGTIYYRQEKFDKAEYHFKRALDINPKCSLLYCYLGMVLLASKRHVEALAALQKATELCPENPQARFQRANVLIDTESYDEALVELKKVASVAPKESSVHFLMGKVCKKLGRTEEALRHFTNASYYNPKDNNVVKMAIDRLYEDEDNNHNAANQNNNHDF